MAPALPAGLFTADPDYAQVVDEIGAGFLVGNYNYAVAAPMATYVRFTITKADVTNIAAGAHRFGLLVMGVVSAP